MRDRELKMNETLATLTKERFESVRGYISEGQVTHLRLHHINSYLYLAFIADLLRLINPPNYIREYFSLDVFNRGQGEIPKYDPEVSYGDLYRNFKKTLRANFEYIKAFLDTVEKNLKNLDKVENALNEIEKTSDKNETIDKEMLAKIKEKLAKIKEKLKKNTLLNLDSLSLIESLVMNRAQILEFVGLYIQTNKDMASQTLESTDFAAKLRAPSDEYDRESKYTGIIVERSVKKSLPANFRPEERTSIMCVRKYEYQQFIADETKHTEIRMGTQIQLDDWSTLGRARVNPSFDLFLQVQRIQATQQKLEAPEVKLESPITHVYINNLKRDHSDSYRLLSIMPMMLSIILQPVCALVGALAFISSLCNYSRDHLESKLTAALGKAEKDNKNLAVITLPADCDMLSRKNIYQSQPEIKREDAYADFLAIAQGKSKRRITDFYISGKVKALLYKEVKEEEKLRELLDQSFKKVVRENKDLSKAQVQAVYFHFMKFELPNFILNTLKPKTFNMSCKDGIDRGGVSSAYFNLIKSIEEKHCMSEPEFNRALHAGPIIVKGRGMNHQSRILWNAVNIYVSNNVDKVPPWLIKWTLQHDEVLIRRLEEIIRPRFFSFHAPDREMQKQAYTLLDFLRSDSPMLEKNIQFNKLNLTNYSARLEQLHKKNASLKIESHDFLSVSSPSLRLGVSV